MEWSIPYGFHMDSMEQIQFHGNCWALLSGSGIHISRKGNLNVPNKWITEKSQKNGVGIYIVLVVAASAAHGNYESSVLSVLNNFGEMAPSMETSSEFIGLALFTTKPTCLNSLVTLSVIGYSTWLQCPVTFWVYVGSSEVGEVLTRMCTSDSEVSLVSILPFHSLINDMWQKLKFLTTTLLSLSKTVKASR